MSDSANKGSASLLTMVQGRVRTRGKMIKVSRQGAVAVTDRELTVGKNLMIVAAGGGAGGTNQQAQLACTVQKGDPRKKAYLLKFLHARSPGGIPELLAFMRERVGLSIAPPSEMALAMGDHGPSSYDFESGRFKIGGIDVTDQAQELKPSYRATPLVRRSDAQSVAASSFVQQPGHHRPLRLDTPDPMKGPIDEPKENDDGTVSMYGIKIRKDQLESLDNIVFKPGGRGKAQRSGNGQNAPNNSQMAQRKSKKTGMLKKMARRLKKDA